MTTPVEVRFTGQESAERLERAIQGVSDRLEGVRRGVGSVVVELVQFGQAISETADRIAALATEDAQLARNAQRLGLDFDAAAEGAGRFTDETEVMAAATQAAAAGVRLSQQELGALTQVAARFSQDTGRSMAEVLGQLTEGTLNGTEALRRFGPQLAALQGPGHTVAERLRVIVQQAGELPRATDDAATSLARMRDIFEDAQRSVAAGFSAEIGQVLDLQGAVRSLTGELGDSQEGLRQMGRFAADIVSATVNAAAAAITTMGIGISSVRDLLAGEGFAGGEGTQALYRLFTNRADAVAEAVDRLGGGGAVAAPTAPPTPSGSDMTFTQEDVAAINADQGARSRRGGAGGAGRARERIREQMAAAAAAKAQESEALARDLAAREANERRGLEAANAAAAEVDRLQREQEQRDMEGRAGQADKEEQARQGELAVRLFERQHDAALAFRDAAVGAYDDVSKAAGEWLVQTVEGVEGASDAFKILAANRIRQISLEAAGQGLQATAEGLYYLFTAPPVAATKFAAAAKFGALALGAGLGGLAVASIPTTPATDRGGRSAGRTGAGETARLDRPAQSPEGPTVVNIHINSGIVSTPRDAARAVRRVLGDGASLTGIGLPAGVLGGG